MKASHWGKHEEHELYTVWAGMKSRCANPKVPNFNHYGGRGIKVCERWRKSFEAFVDDLPPRPSPAHSIHRINNDGNYEPGNVKWATDKEQCQTRRRFPLKGSLRNECAKLGLRYGTVWMYRKRNGCTNEQALAFALERKG